MPENKFNELKSVVSELSEKCPWDKKQTFQSLRSLTIEEVYEPFLVQEGYIKRTQKGRVATKLSFSHLGIDPKGGYQNQIFND